MDGAGKTTPNVIKHSGTQPQMTLDNYGSRSRNRRKMMPKQHVLVGRYIIHTVFQLMAKSPGSSNTRPILTAMATIETRSQGRQDENADDSEFISRRLKDG